MKPGKFNAGRRGSVLSEINITPFVDVMLVLLVIFMVTTPILYQGIRVDLPQTASSKIPIQDDKRVTITLTGRGKIFLEDSSYELSEIGGALQRFMKAEKITSETGRIFSKGRQIGQLRIRR